MSNSPQHYMYTRNRGGVIRYYADFREFADVGGRREALVDRQEASAKGSKRARATSDPAIAQELASKRLKELMERRRNKALLGIEDQAALGEFATYHLEERAKAGNVTEQWLESMQVHLETAVAHFGKDRTLDSIGVRDVQGYIGYLQLLPNRKGQRCPECGRKGQIPPAGEEPVATCPACHVEWRIGTLSGGSQLKYLNSLSNLYRRAAGEGYVRPGYNPVHALLEKPQAGRREAEWLEVPDGALILEAARHHKPERSDGIPPAMAHALIATFLLTGGREAEVLGLMLDDISFDRRKVTFRPNAFRTLKTSTSHRTISMWPQLEDILRGYVFGGDAPKGQLLFPSPRVRDEQMITDVRKLLDRLAERCDWSRTIRTKIFRHTYCAARLQTLDGGKPVSLYTVGREMGHGGDALVRRVYGHLGEIRHRAEEVEFRVEQHTGQIGDAVRALRATANRQTHG